MRACVRRYTGASLPSSVEPRPHETCQAKIVTSFQGRETERGAGVPWADWGFEARGGFPVLLITMACSEDWTKAGVPILVGFFLVELAGVH